MCFLLNIYVVPIVEEKETNIIDNKNINSKEKKVNKEEETRVGWCGSEKKIAKSIIYLDQGWTVRLLTIVSRRRARGWPRAPGRDGAASGGENPGLVAEQHFPDLLRNFAELEKIFAPFARIQWRERKRANLIAYVRSITNFFTDFT